MLYIENNKLVKNLNQAYLDLDIGVSHLLGQGFLLDGAEPVILIEIRVQDAKIGLAVLSSLQFPLGPGVTLTFSLSEGSVWTAGASTGGTRLLIIFDITARLESKGK